MSLENPFEPIMEGLKDLRSSFKDIRERKDKETELRMKEDELRIKATEVYSKIEETEGKKAARERLAEAVNNSKFVADPALAQAMIRAGASFSPLINTRAVRGMGGGGGGVGGGDGGGGVELSSTTGLKWMNAKSMDKLKARLVQEIPAIPFMIKDVEAEENLSEGKKAVKLEELRDRQELLMAQLDMLERMTGKKQSYGESLKQIRTNVGNEQFETMKSDLAPHVDEFKKIMEEEGYPQDVLEDLEKGFVLDALEKTGDSLHGDAFVGWYKTIKPTVQGIKERESEMEQFYNIIGNSDSATLKDMLQDKGVSDFERKAIAETYMLRKTGDVMEKVTGKVLGPIFPIDVTPSIKKRVGDIPQLFFKKRRAGERLEELLKETAIKRKERKKN